MTINQRGLAPIFIIIAALLIIGGVVAFYQINSHQIAPTPSPSPIETASPTFLSSDSSSASPSSSPKPTIKPTAAPNMIDCVGPDGKHSQKTKTNCDAFLKAWATPTPKASASPTSSASTSSGGCEIGQANIGVSADNGPIVGDALITVTVDSSSCASTYNNYKILSQGSSSANFSGILPGNYHVKVLYHGKEFNDSFGLSNAGNVSKTVGVSN